MKRIPLPQILYSIQTLKVRNDKAAKSAWVTIAANIGQADIDRLLARYREKFKHETFRSIAQK